MKLIAIAALWCVTACWATPVPSNFSVSVSSRGNGYQKVQGDFWMTMLGGTGQGQALFFYTWQLNADIEDNGYLLSAINGSTSFYFDSGRQNPTLGPGLAFTYGVPQYVHVELTASVNHSPNSSPFSLLSGRLALDQILAFPVSGGSTNSFLLEPVSVPEPASLTLFAAPLLWFGYRRRFKSGPSRRPRIARSR